MTDFNVYDTAAALYDGGWRYTDKDELITAYDFADEEAESICDVLKTFEERANRRGEEDAQ